jgi:hypothetical protein
VSLLIKARALSGPIREGWAGARSWHERGEEVALWCTGRRGGGHRRGGPLPVQFGAGTPERRGRDSYAIQGWML